MAVTTPPAAAVEHGWDSVRRAARTGAPDRYLAALLAPRAVQSDLIALAAFAAEIEKIVLQVGEPHLGEIRILWWRDALHAGASGDRSGHPVADAFSQAVVRHALPLELVDDYLAAVSHTLYTAPPADDGALSLRLDFSEGVPFALAARILGAAALQPSDDAVHSAAQAYGLSRLGLTIPHLLARGRNPLPPSLVSAGSLEPDWREAIAALARDARMQLEHASRAFAAEPRVVRTALLPIALVEPYLRALTRSSHDPSRDLAEIAPLTRLWRLGCAHVRGRL